MDNGGRGDLRPATDRTRQAVFSSLASVIEGAACADLFAGTGAYGLEALSRGAASVRFVEQDRKSVLAIGKNVQAVCKSIGIGTQDCFVEQRDVFARVAGAPVFDLVFADPPYALLPGRAAEIFAIAATALVPDGLFVFEMPGGLNLNDSRMDLIKRLGKGRNAPSVCVFSMKKPLDLS